MNLVRLPPRRSAPRMGSIVACDDRWPGRASAHASVRRVDALSKDGSGERSSMLVRATLLTFDRNRFAETSVLSRKLLSSAEPDYRVAVDRISSPLSAPLPFTQIPTLLDNSSPSRSDLYSRH
jgi:hypothetical protein